jgi:hypothetical protein
MRGTLKKRPIETTTIESGWPWDRAEPTVNRLNHQPINTRTHGRAEHATALSLSGSPWAAWRSLSLHARIVAVPSRRSQRAPGRCGCSVVVLPLISCCSRSCGARTTVGGPNTAKRVQTEE